MTPQATEPVPLQSTNETPRNRVDYKSVIKSFITRMVIIYAVSNFFKKPRTSNDQPGFSSNITSCKTHNKLPLYENLDVYFYLNDEMQFDNFSRLFWKISKIRYGDWAQGINHDSIFEKHEKIPISSKTKNNGSLFLFTYLVKHGHSPNPLSDLYDPNFTFSNVKRLNKYRKKVYKKTHNLLTGQSKDQESIMKLENGTKSEILSHWHPNLTINLLVDNTSWVPGSIPHPIDQFIVFDANDPCIYDPVIYANDFWNLASDYYPINETSEYLNFSLTFSPISMLKWQLYVSQDVKNKWVTLLTEGNLLGSNTGSGTENSNADSPSLDNPDDGKDAFKRALLETNPYLLGLTIIVSIVHSVFELLAFKNDIQFWKSRQSLEGLSIRSVFFNILSSFIVFLYIMDNETNFMVRVTVFIGLLIDIWKITKCVDFYYDPNFKYWGILPGLRFKHKSTYIESDTKVYDKLAFKYLSWILFPLLIGYSIYSVVYQEHKGWYSFVLNILYGFLLTFGFIMMTPQLFINYKLKSVAHLPWRMLTYKALNTFIDDIFAFVIKMPTMYRIGCFRDDIIFFIYVYQRWIYKTDMKRVNEFGASGVDLIQSKDFSENTPKAICNTIETKDGEPIIVNEDDTKVESQSDHSQGSEDSFEKIENELVENDSSQTLDIQTPTSPDSIFNENYVVKRSVHVNKAANMIGDKTEE